MLFANKKSICILNLLTPKNQGSAISNGNFNPNAKCFRYIQNPQAQKCPNA